MTDYRIVEAYRKIWIEKQLKGDLWVKVDIKDVPKYHDTVADARSWVATIKRGVVYHDAEDADVGLQWFINRVGQTVHRLSVQDPTRAVAVEIIDNDHAHQLYRASVETDTIYKDAPNLAQDERKPESDTSDGIKPLGWFEERLGCDIDNVSLGYSTPCRYPQVMYGLQKSHGWRYADPQ